MLMQIRMLIAALTLLLLPREELTVASFLMLLSIFIMSWLAGRAWQRIAPRMAAHPLLFGLDMWISCAVFVVSGSTSGPFFLCTAVTPCLAGLLYRWQGMLIVAGLQMLSYYAAYLLTLPEGAQVTFQAAFSQPLYYPLAGFAGVALRRLLDDYAAQEAARWHAEVNAAAAEERARLAREMHDSLVKTLRGISLSAAALPNWVSRDRQRAINEAKKIAEATENASREARHLLTELRDDELTRPFGEVVAERVEHWGDEAGLEIERQIDPRIDLPQRARHEAMAILGEALTNVQRHSGAGHVHVRLARDGADVVLTVRDDGDGFHLTSMAELARAGHYGLIGLSERATRAGGTITVASKPGSGTAVTLRIHVGNFIGKSVEQVAEVS
ncbi:sensor histidine kinase [Actinomadura kijaniata]|uniref:sensor histidine kinase n=1 Tax=Actinomadura kijaniata TaxID=46161 RepID=UPI003F1DDF94